MLYRRSQFRSQLNQMVDALVTIVAFTGALAARRLLNTWRPDIFAPFDALWQHAWLYVLIVPLWMVLLEANGFYRHPFARSPWTTLVLLLRTNALGIMGVFFVFYLLKVKHIPRVLIIIYGMLDTVMLWVKETLMRKVLPLWTTPARLLLVGTPADLEPVVRQLSHQPPWSSQLVGMLQPTDAVQSPSASEPSNSPREELPPLLGTTEKLVSVLHDHAVDSVLLAPGRQTVEEIQQILRICETEGVEAWLLANFFQTRIARAYVDEFQNQPVLVFRSTPDLCWALVVKRIMDVVGSLVLVILLSPLWLAIALAIKLTSPGPVFFRQTRCTLHGRPFTMYKFRTMVADAEAQRAALDPHNEVGGPVFKIRNDPRVTPVGRFLRRHSLDELPQLLNVLAGHMSLVGPRPPIPAEVAKYENWQRRRLSMRSGITCLWQVSGRNALPFEDWMRLDLEYIDRWSLGLDLWILCKTPLAVIRGTGF